jgi:hypothetical protein
MADGGSALLMKGGKRVQHYLAHHPRNVLRLERSVSSRLHLKSLLVDAEWTRTVTAAAARPET